MLLFVQFGYSQYRFESGYYISNDGAKTDCLIEKKEWANWSNKFFNTSINGSVEQIKIADVKEFGIDNKLKFITHETQIEKSLDYIEKLDKSKDFDFNKERVLLKVIVEGDLSLYQYLENNVKKFFYKTTNSDIMQLKYKRYVDENYAPRIVLNTVIEYKNQLEEDAKCSGNNFSKLNYELSSLKKYIISQNKCSNSEIIFASKRITQTKLAISASVGLNISNLDVQRSGTTFTLNSINPSFGIDLDFLIPTITGDLELNFKAHYSSFKIKEDIEFGLSSVREVQVEYSEVLLGIGGGYRFYLDNDKSITLGGGINYPLLINNTKYTETGSNLNLLAKEANPFFSISTSMHIKKINFRAEYLFKRNIMEGVNNFKIDLSRIALRIGYTII